MNETIDQLGNLVHPQLVSVQNSPLQREIDLHPRRMFSVIAAVDLDGGFAKAGQIPWHYSEDFKWFKNRTDGAICVMGKNAYVDINARLGEKAVESVLPGRTCFVVSTTLDAVPNATVIRSLTDLNQHLTPDDMREVHIIGGGQLFSEGISKADVAYITVVNDTHECDAWFPVKYLQDHFIVQTIYKGQEEKLRFIVYKRKQPNVVY